MPSRQLLAAAVLAVTSVSAHAQACSLATSAGKCVAVPPSQQTTPGYAVGDVFPVYEHNMVLNTERHGLAPVDGSWRYYEQGSAIYRVSVHDHRVLEVIPHAGAHRKDY